MLSKKAARIVKRLRGDAFNAAKAVYQRAKYRPDCPKSIGLIMGFQRSGTGMLDEAFGRDWSCIAYSEDGGLAIGEHAGLQMRWRWKDYLKVAEILGRQRAPLLIAKPLVESQWAEFILQILPGAKIIWAYRHYKDVALSSQQRFGPEPIKFNLRSVIEDRPRHWFCENLDDETRQTVATYFDESRPIWDLWALGWYVRNSYVFRYSHLPVIMSRYESLVVNPEEEMRRLYAFLGREYPGNHVIAHMHFRSVNRGKDVPISDDIAALCDPMLARLDALRASQYANDASGATVTPALASSAG